MPIYKIFFPTLAALIILRGLYLTIKGKIGWREFIFWGLFWTYFGLLAAYPQTIQFFAKITGIQDSVSAFFASVIMILIFIILKMFLMIEKLDRDLTKVIRSISLKEAKEKKGKKN